MSVRVTNEPVAIAPEVEEDRFSGRSSGCRSRGGRTTGHPSVPEFGCDPAQVNGIMARLRSLQPGCPTPYSP
jgi:hypothetical protein